MLRDQIRIGATLGSVAFVILLERMTYPASAENKFCLLHPQGQIYRFGCTSAKIPNRDEEVVRCLNVERTGSKVITEFQGFARIAANDGACNPWNPPPDKSEGVDHPRGNEDDPVDAGKAIEPTS